MELSKSLTSLTGSFDLPMHDTSMPGLLTPRENQHEHEPFHEFLHDDLMDDY